MTLSESQPKGIPRAQSSLELLSQTAAVFEEESKANLIEPSNLSPFAPIARVTPAEPMEQQKLALPELVGPTRYMLQPRLVEQSMNVPSSATETTSWVSNMTSGTRHSHYHVDDPNHPSNGVFLPSPSFGSTQSAGSLEHENMMLKTQLAAKDSVIDSLNQQLQNLQKELRRMRQMPSGKISQIPLEDMLAIMREYGSEVSETAMPPRKTYVQRASVVRQFRRWNPNFLDWFEYIDGIWMPKLGKDGELKRRQQARKEASETRRLKPAKSNTTTTQE